jgi:hypothetical protein
MIQTTDELYPRNKNDETHLRNAGFQWGPRFTHINRTIILNEVQALLACCQPDERRDGYLAAIQEDNCLGKCTVATLKLSGQRLSGQYYIISSIT